MSAKPEIYMRRAALISLFCNIALVMIKSTALILINSLAIAVDLGISFVGLAVSIILFYSIKLANRPADVFHNYGYGKVENVCEALEGVVLIGIALALSSQAVLHLFHPRHVGHAWIGLVSCSISAVINFGGAYYILKMGKKSGSPAIKAEGLHYRMEGYISGMIWAAFLIAIFLQSAGRTFLANFVDPLAALLVSCFLVVPSYQLAKNSFFKLLDSSVAEDSQMEILKQLSGHINRFCEFQNLRTRTAGRKKFVEFDLVVPEDISFKKGHEVVRFLENDIRSRIPNCEVLIRMEPCKKDCEYIKTGAPCPYL